MATSEAAKKKRRLKAPTETVRDKAAKAQVEVVSQNEKSSWLVLALGSPFHGLAWLSHRPPLKQIGHGLRWFFLLKPLRWIGIGLGFRYIRNSWKELKLVTWPTRSQSRRLTTAVVIFSIIFGGFIALVDFGLDKLFKQVIIR